MIGTNVEGFEVNLNKSLYDLDISYNGSGPEGARYLFEALKVNKTLRDLDISYDYFGDKGAWHLAEALKMNETLHTLNLERAIVQKQGIKLFIWWLKSNFLRRHKSQTSGSHGHHKPQVLGHHKLRGPVR